MFIIDQIDPFVFLVSLCVGIFISYIFRKEPRVVVKHPTPENAGKITYVDDAGICYRYRAQEVDCPSDKSQIKQIPLQY